MSEQQGAKIKVFLTDEELQLPEIDDVSNKYLEWLRLSKETAGGRKTRSANKRADMVFEEIMSFRLQPLATDSSLISPSVINNLKTTDSTADSDSDSSNSRPNTRSLRPRSKTPQSKTYQLRQLQPTSPATPSNQRIRANITRNGAASGTNSSNSSAGSYNHHPTAAVSATKIRQLLRADSAQKRRDEERERQERLQQERKLKEERAEQIKREQLERRAATAKLKREQRLLHAAEVRRAREDAKRAEKAREDKRRVDKNKDEEEEEYEEPPRQAPTKQNHQPAKAQPQHHQQQPQAQPAENNHKQAHNHQNATHNHHNNHNNQDRQPNAQQSAHQQQHHHKEPQKPKPVPKAVEEHKLNETFKKPSEGMQVNNIDISIQDETTDEKSKATGVADWAKAPHLRDALIKQFSQTEAQLQSEVIRIFQTVELPVELNQIFGSSKAVGTRYLCRTSSAQWTPPNKALKRTSSMTMTPTNPEKR